MDSFDVNVKDFQGGSVVIKVYPTWNVSTVKQEIASKTNVNPHDFRIVFAGQTLSDSQTLWVSLLLMWGGWAGWELVLIKPTPADSKGSVKLLQPRENSVYSDLATLGPLLYSQNGIL